MHRCRYLQSNVQWGPSMMSQKKSPRTAETMFKLFSVVQEYKRMTLQWNFTHLNYFQPMTGQQFSQKFNAVIALKERNADGWNFFDQMYPQLPLRQWGAGNIYLLATVVQLKGKHCRKPHCCNETVGQFFCVGLGSMFYLLCLDSCL